MTSDAKNSNLLKNKTEVDILDLVGNNGPWQRMIFIFTFIALIPIASHSLIITFFAPNLDVWCSRPPGVNITVEEWKLHGLPPHDKICSRYKFFNASYSSDKNDSNIIPCDSWEYDKSRYISTIVSEWNLVCEKEWLVSFSKSVFVFGHMFSTSVAGYISDKYGRKPVIVGGNIIALFSSIICAFSTSFLMFSILRLIIAFGVNVVFESAFVLLMEVSSPAYRPIYGLSVELGWCVGFLGLPLISWILHDWFWIQLFVTIPSAFLLSTYWFLPESPRWLVSQGKIEEVENVLIKARKMNGIEATDLKDNVKKIIFDKSKEEKEKNKCVNFLDLLKIPGIWKITLNLFYLWWVLGFVYYGLTYNTNELAGDPFINFAASGAVEIPGYLIPVLIIKWYGRRKPLSAFLIIGGVACLVMYPLPADIPWIGVTVSMVGKFFITCAFGTIYIYTTEIFPTVVRNEGITWSILCSRIGSIIAPFARELGNATHSVVPQIIFGILAAIGGLLVLLLPETNNCTVPDTLEEAANFTMSDKRKANKMAVEEVCEERMSTKKE